ncbi:NADPH-dependent F420 reductase [Nocardioides sp.]|uniref:NADPH-dependent F420 reductase n=1 Tax=Nocardioides sp. TaxID=35761 RepID=UPI0027334D63|nr:NAD(P)-binding domain-containing protein [Nocardioides sp.]MDP3890547.1 NAD(P)-binding domain-containing protein [Nocardioides sp.]
MKIAVLGSGTVGRTLAEGLAARHEVVIGTRDPEATAGRADWPDDLPGLAAYADAVADTEVVVNATNGQASLDVLGAAGDLDGVVLLDVANPLDFSAGFPPSLSVKDTDSLAEQIQRAHPGARVVKSLNTVAADVMVDPGRVGDGDTTVFIAGDDAAARAVVRGLLQELGWRDVLEFDSLEPARGLEMWLPLWIRIMQQTGHGDFNLKLVR